MCHPHTYMLVDNARKIIQSAPRFQYFNNNVPALLQRQCILKRGGNVPFLPNKGAVGIINKPPLLIDLLIR